MNEDNKRETTRLANYQHHGYAAHNEGAINKSSRRLLDELGALALKHKDDPQRVYYLPEIDELIVMAGSGVKKVAYGYITSLGFSKLQSISVYKAIEIGEL